MESITTDAPVTVGIGVHVEMDLIDEQGHCEPLAVDIVKAQAADLAQGFLGANTPLARAIRVCGSKSWIGIFCRYIKKGGPQEACYGCSARSRVNKLLG